MTLTLPPIGFGTAGIANLYSAVSDEIAAATLRAALAGGIFYFDTAPYYGLGLGEKRLGDALSGCDVVVSTKVGRRLVPISHEEAAREDHGFADADPNRPTFDYSYDGVMASFESSRQRLCRQHIDILFVHDLGRLVHGDDHPAHLATFLSSGWPAMCELKASGAVRAIGVGVNEWQVCEELLAGGVDLDIILLAGRYTLLEQTALDSFLPLAARKEIPVIVGGPYNSGILAQADPGDGAARYDYAAAPPEIVERVRSLRSVCAAHGIPLAAAALQFPLAHPQVASVIPGMSSPAEVAQTLAWASWPIPDALWNDLRRDGLLHPNAPTPVQG